MENNKQAINKLELLLRAMAKAQGIDPDSKMNDWNEKEVKAVAECRGNQSMQMQINRDA